MCLPRPLCSSGKLLSKEILKLQRHILTSIGQDRKGYRTYQGTYRQDVVCTAYPQHPKTRDAPQNDEETSNGSKDGRYDDGFGAASVHRLGEGS